MKRAKGMPPKGGRPSARHRLCCTCRPPPARPDAARGPTGEATGTMTDEAAPAHGKRMARDYFFPTPIYYTGSRAGGDPQRAPRRGRPRVAGAGPRGDVPIERAAARGLAQRDRHAPASRVHRSHPRDLRTDPRRVRGPGLRRRLRAGLRLDVGERQSARRVQPAITPTRTRCGAACTTSAPRDDCGLLCLTDPRPQAHVLTPYFDPKAPAPPTPGARSTTSPGPAGSSPFPDGSSTPPIRTWRAPAPRRARPGNAGGRAGSEGAAPEEEGGRPRPRTDQASASTSGSGARTPTRPRPRSTRWCGRTCRRGEALADPSISPLRR